MKAQQHNRQQSRPFGIALSVAAHAVVAALLLVTVSRSPAIAPFKLPGTKLGTHLLTYYSPGFAAPKRTQSALPSPIAQAAQSSLHSPATPAAKPATASAAPAEAGTGTAALSGEGEGDITIALVNFFPSPKPDLSTLPQGHHGDVVLNAVIDDQGKIAKLTLLEGITPAINDSVIATVQTWTFKPALHNGTPVQSEQELHFHYERG